MKKCIIITSHIEGKIKNLINLSHDDYIICADGGLDLALMEGIMPSIVIGDFDSVNTDIPDELESLVVSSVKNETDTFLCLDHALKQGFTNALIIGGMGGRLDHTMANLQGLFYYAKAGLTSMIIDEGNIAMPLINAATVISKKEGYMISLFSHSEVCKEVTIEGVKYPLTKHTLDSNFPLGVSNEFEEEEAFVEVLEGELLVILSKD